MVVPKLNVSDVKPPVNEFKVKEAEEEEIFDPDIDGGRAWITIAAIFFPFFAFGGSIYGFGVLVPPLLVEFPEVGRAGVALLGSTSTAIFLASGPISGRLSDKYGCVPVMLFGGIMLGIGYLIGSFCSGYFELLASIGITVGIGFGFVFVPAISQVNKRFVKYRGFANGLAVSGTGVGTSVLALVNESIITSYGWRMVFRTAAVYCTVFICGCVALLMVPGVGDRSRMRSRSSSSSSSSSSSLDSSVAAGDNDNGRNKSSEMDAESVEMNELAALAEGKEKEDENEKNGSKSRSKIFDLSLFSDPNFVLMFLFSFVTSFGYLVPFLFLVRSGISLGMSSSTAANLMLVVGLCNTISRVVVGYAADAIFGRLNTMIFSMLVMGIGTILWGFITSEAVLFAYAAIFGVFAGSFIAMIAPLTSDLFIKSGHEKIGLYIGMQNFAAAFGAILGPALAGWMLDTANGSFTVPAIVSGALMALSVVMLVIVNQRARRQKLMFGGCGIFV